MKNNDWIVANLNNPDFNVQDFQYILDLDLDNTQFLPESEYLKSSKITNDTRFQNKDGQFDEKLFDQFYKKSAETFKDFSVESILNNYEYGLWDIEKPKDGKVKNPNFSLSVESNPSHIRIGVQGFNQVTPSAKSKRELAQSQPIYDSKKGEFLNESVNDISLFSNPIKYIKSLFEDPLIYATYDEDTIVKDPITGKLVERHKGDYKLNSNGEYYTEKLNGRSLIGKQVVSSMDYLTSEDSNINRYDFFDADDLDKSTAGTVASLVATVAPLFTPLSTAYSGFLVAREISKSLPMLYGIMQGFLGNDPDSKLLNTIAGYGNKFTQSNTDYSQSQMFSLENLGKLIGDVATQWGQQQFIARSFAKLSTGSQATMKTAEAKAAAEYTKGVQKALDQVQNGSLSMDKFINTVGIANFGNIGDDLIKSGIWKNSVMGQAALKKYIPKAQEIFAKRMQIGQDLSLVYMAIISNTDVYESVLQHGGTPFEAAAIALGSTVGMFSVDKYMGLGEMFFQDDLARQAIRTGSKDAVNDLLTTMGAQETKQITQKQTLNWINAGINSGKKAVDNYFEKMRNHTLPIAGKALGEGLEEVSEEIVTDMSKWLGEVAGQLGYFSQEDYGAWDNMQARYAMSLLGGTLGGGIFGVKMAIDNKKMPEFQNDLIYLIRQGKKNEIKKEFQNLYDDGKMGSKELSIDTVMNESGEPTPLTADSEHESQADYTLRTLNNIVDQLDAALNENDLNLSEDELFDKLVQGEYRTQALNQYLASHQKTSYVTNFQQNFQNLANKIILKQQELDKFIKDTSDPAKRGTDFQEKLNKLKEDLAELQGQKEYLFGEGSLGYLEKLLFAVDIGLSGAFISPTKEEYIKNNLHKDIKDLTPAENIEWTKKYEQYCKSSKKTDLDTAFKLFKQMQKRINPSVQELNKLDLEKDLERFKEIINKYPFDQAKGEFDKLDGETDEDIKKLYKQEGESDEDYAKRRKKRQEIVKQYNSDHSKEWVSQFADLNLDKQAVRQLQAQLGIAYKTQIRKITDRFYIENNARLAAKIREILNNNGDDDQIYKAIIDSVTDQINEKYGMIDQIPSYFFFNLFKILGRTKVINGDEIVDEQEYLNKNDIYEIFQKWAEGKELTISNAGNLINEFNKYIHEQLSPEYNESLKTNVTLQKQDKFLKEAITYAVTKAIEEENGIERIPSSDYVTLSNRKYDIINSISDDMFGQLLATINKVRDTIESDETLEVLKKLEKESYAKNPALKVVQAISDENIEQILENIYELFQNDSEQFTLSGVQIEQLTQLFRDIELAMAFIHAAAQNTNLENPIGHNKFLNEYTRRHSDVFKNWEELPEINSDTAYILINELLNYQKEINNWINLSNKNSGNVMQSLIKSKFALQKTKLDIYKNNRDAFKITPTLDLLDGYDELELDDSFQSVINVESLLHNNYIKALNNGVTLTQILDKLIKNLCRIPDLNKQEQSNLDEHLTYNNFTDFDKLMQIICNFAISDENFYTKIKEVIENNEGFVPISIQEEVAKMVLANGNSLETINTALDFINSKLETKLPVLYNASIVTGVAGAGKSYLMSHIADENVWISGPTQNQIDGLSVYMPKGKQISKEDLFKIIIGDEYTKFKENPLNYGTSNVGLNSHKVVILKNSIKVNKTDDAPRQLVIDEASHFNSLELQLISKWARENGVHLILIAGSSQNGYDTDEMENLNREVCLAWRTPNLFISLRNSNIQKVQNLKTLDTTINELDKVEENTEEAISKIKSKGIHLHYFNGDKFTGEWITDKLTDVSKLNGTIAFIGNGDSSIYKLLKENGKNPVLINPLEVQGQEYDYVIVDKHWEFGSEDPYDEFLALRDLYTMGSRSKQGTIIIRNNLPDYIINSEDSYTYISDIISKALDEFKKPRLEELDNVKFPTTLKITEPKEVEESKKVEEPKEVEESKEDTPIIDNSALNPEENDEVNSSVDSSVDIQVGSKGGLLNQFPIRCYGNVSYSGIKMKDDKSWVNSNNSHTDLGIFLKGSTKSPKTQEKLVRLLLQMKCLFQYGTEYYDKADREIKNRFTKENFENAKFFIKVEEPTESNKLIGLTDLKNEERTIGNGKVVKLIAKIKDRNNVEWELSLGGLANPKTWKDNKKAIKDALREKINKGNKELQSYYDNIDAIIDEYTTFIEQHTQSVEEIEIPKPIFSQMTTIVHKNALFRLEEIDPDNHFSPYKYASHYSVDSDVYVITDDDLPNFPEDLKGKPVMFVSSNVFLSKGELKDQYIKQRKTNMSGEVRMLVLDNLGVSFRSLHQEKYKAIYTTTSGKNKFHIPMKSAPEGIRMYSAMWNFRANLKAFNTRYKTFVKENKLSLSDVHQICKLDNQYYQEIKGKESYLSESDYRKKVEKIHPENLDKLKLIWDFNDNLGDQVREFRLGYNRQNGAYIRKLTNLTEGKFYNDISKVNGIYINPEIAELYEVLLDRMFENIFDKIITVKDGDENVLLNKSELKGTDWFKSAKDKGELKIPIQLDDNITSPKTVDITFDGSKALSSLTLLTIQLGKFLDYQTFYPEFKKYLKDRNKDDKRFRMFYGEEELHWEDILDDISIDGIEFVETNDEDTYDNETNPIGINYYTIKNGKKIGFYDVKVRNLFSLMFHGLISLETENDFTKGDIRASDAEFKYGFFSDPLLVKKEDADNKFTETISSRKFFGVNAVPGFPLIGIILQPTSVSNNPPEESTNIIKEVSDRVNELNKIFNSSDDPAFFDSVEEVNTKFINKAKNNLINALNSQSINENIVIYIDGKFQKLNEKIQNIESIEYDPNGFFVIKTSDNEYSLTLNRNEAIIEPIKQNNVGEVEVSEFQDQIEKWINSYIKVYNEDNQEDQIDNKDEIIDEIRNIVAEAGTNIVNSETSNIIIDRIKQYLIDQYILNSDIIDKYKEKGGIDLDALRINNC